MEEAADTALAEVSVLHSQAAMVVVDTAQAEV